MSTNRYEEVTSWLFQQFPSYQLIGSKAYKPTLENTRVLLERIGNPEKSLKFVHVAGSNGKGSVSSMLASILTENGLKTGLFTSPHIMDFRERIRIDGSCISEQGVIDFVDSITSQEWDVEPSFFEITFAMAVYHFREMKCDVCVIETGLGGRLDATNVIQPLASAITSISLEHTQILGNTLAKIAFEKGGIIKDHIPLVIGQLPEVAELVLTEICQERNAPLLYSKAIQINQYQVPLIGAHQKANFKVVCAMLSILKNQFILREEHIQPGLNKLHRNTGFTGRLQIISRDPLVIYDVSHNAEGLETSFKAVEEINDGKLHIVYGTSSDKDLRQIIPCFNNSAFIYLCEFNNPRSMNVEQLKSAFTQYGRTVQGAFKSGIEALNAAKTACSSEDVILVTGSFFLLSDFFQKNL